MALRLRFALLILALFAVLLGSLWLHNRLNTADTLLLRATLQQDREALVQRLVELTSEPLRIFTADYSPWDELVNYVKNPDPAWSRDNIDTTFDTYRVDAVWILRPDFSEVYGIARDKQSELRPFPFSPEILKKLTAASGEPHCFVQTAAGLLEIRGAAIRPSDRSAVIPAPYGWLFAARKWDERYLRQLEMLLDGNVQLANGNAPTFSVAVLATALPLHDWADRPINELRTTLTTPALLRAETDGPIDLLFLFSFGLIALLAYSIATQIWVMRPLRHLAASLKQRSALPLAGLLRAGGEFGALGRIVEASFQQEEKLRQIYTAFNAIDDAVFITAAADGRILHVNLGVTRLLGHDATSLVGRTLAELQSPPPGGTEGGLWFRCHDGRLVEVEAKEQALPGPAPTKMNVTVARDISDRRQQEKQRLSAQRLESLGTLASGVAHDMNNMLTPIILLLDDLQNFNQSPSPALLASVRSSVKRGATILRQLLTFGHGFEGERLPLNLGSLVEELGRIVTSTFPKAITFETKIASKLPTVVGDPTQLHQVLLNLCVNARDALPHGGTITVSVNHQVIDAGNTATWPEAALGHHVRIEVSDTGTGIPPEIIDRIFDPFFTTKSADKGTGLGLSTTLGIVHGHDGVIQVRSEIGRGTCFSILLPATSFIPTKSTPSTIAPMPAALCNGAGRTVLVIEDEETIRNILVRSLARISLKVIAAGEGGEGLALFQKHRAEISLVITDLNMPGMDGLTLLKGLRAEAPALPILVMSGRIDDSTLATLNQLTVSGILNKPFGYSEIIDAMRRLLG